MARGLKLKRYGVTNQNYQWLGAYRIRVEVASVCGGMDPNIFIYRRDPFNPLTNEQLDTYLAMASPADMSWYPALEPNSETEFPFFRQNFIELDFHAVNEAEAAWVVWNREANILCEALDQLEQLILTEEVNVGAICAGSESGSGSASESHSTSESFNFHV